MMTHEQRIADLERQVAELKRIVGAPPGAIGGVCSRPLSSLAMPNAVAAQVGLARNPVSQAQAQGAANCTLVAQALYEGDPRMTR